MQWLVLGDVTHVTSPLMDDGEDSVQPSPGFSHQGVKDVCFGFCHGPMHLFDKCIFNGIIFFYIYASFLLLFFRSGSYFFGHGFLSKFLARKHILLLLSTLRLIDRVCLEIKVFIFLINQIFYGKDSLYSQLVFIFLEVL